MAFHGPGSKSAAGAEPTVEASEDAEYGITDLVEALDHAVMESTVQKAYSILTKRRKASAVAAHNAADAMDGDSTDTETSDTVTPEDVKYCMGMIKDKDFLKFAEAFARKLLQSQPGKLASNIVDKAAQRAAVKAPLYRSHVVERLEKGVTRLMMKTELHLSMLRLDLMDEDSATADAKAIFQTELSLKEHFAVPMSTLGTARAEKYPVGAAAIAALLQVMETRVHGYTQKNAPAVVQSYFELHGTIAKLSSLGDSTFTAVHVIECREEKLVAAFNKFALDYTVALRRWLQQNRVFQRDGDDFHSMFPIAKASFGTDGNGDYSESAQPFRCWEALLKTIHKLAGVDIEAQPLARLEGFLYSAVLLRFQDAWAELCLKSLFHRDLRIPVESPLLESHVLAITRITGAAVAFLKSCAADRPNAAAAAARAAAMAAASSAASSEDMSTD